MERFLAENDKYKVVGFNLAYTGGRVGHDQKVVVAELCMHHHGLPYHQCLATLPYECFTKLVNIPDYRFAMVDTTNDRMVLKTLGLAYYKLVDIREHYNI
ncbi:Serine/threonine-protein kinase [Hordeum vulgare]|nr:Serine/threonine-protein kinase [Hordeum vulgare]